ncbi:MAG TPA: xanthine dehydrogenase family protein subunit M [Candidatus Sulfotelmatobacter sp.]|nr:xanthine dehydrogenase family protein subunit M [Candidatus Sulfotelmatobacter sp.]
MKPAAFDYIRPDDLDAALAALAELGGDAKLLAGGQSLMPLLNFRMLRPRCLIDINRLSALDHVTEDAGGLRIGALTRHHVLETSAAVAARFPVLAEAMRHVAHLAIRNRGTIGGSLCHADPAAELPMMALLLDAEIELRTHDGARRIAAQDFFVGPLATALGETEMATEIRLPALPPRAGWGFEEFALRAGDFAFAAAAALVTVADGRIADARLALMGVDDTPVRLRDTERALAGQSFSSALAADVGAQARAAVHPNSDLRASADYRRHLVAALTERALTRAWQRAHQAAA